MTLRGATVVWATLGRLPLDNLSSVDREVYEGLKPI